MLKVLSSPSLTSKTTQTRPQVFSVNGSKICNFAALLTLSVQYGKIIPNLVNSSWLWWIMCVILAGEIFKDEYNMKIYGDREAKVFSEEVDNTFLDLHNSSDYIKAESKNCFIID